MRMSDGSYYLKSYAEMAALFGERARQPAQHAGHRRDVPGGPRLQRLSPAAPSTCRPATTRPAICAIWWTRASTARYGDRASDPEIQARKEHELKIIHDMGFDTYFLIVWDLCEFARQRDIWWNVRGSGAGSIVAYAAGITNLDPLANHLLFERFLNPGRVTMPDIDLDYPDDRREEMINYTVEKYGQENVAQIITFGTHGRASRHPRRGPRHGHPAAGGGPHRQADPRRPQGEDQRCAGAVAGAAASCTRARITSSELIDTAVHLEGVARHASTHAAGVVIADKPLVEYTPLHRPTKGDARRRRSPSTRWRSWKPSACSRSTSWASRR